MSALRDDWRKIEAFLRAAIASLPDPEPEDAISYINHNEFELAYNEIKIAAARTKPGPAYAPCMSEAARIMGFPDWRR